MWWWFVLMGMFVSYVSMYVQLSIANVVTCNGSSLPLRLPDLTLALKGSYACSYAHDSPMYTIVALSYRGF